VFVPLATAIKSVVRIPLITVGRIRTPELADQIIKENKADFVAMGRALIADPELPRKAQEGRGDQIRPCISCNRCVLNIRKGAVQCAVNPEAGREELLKMEKAKTPKKVWVIGGGPAGLKAAEVAARRGHRVTLFEKNNQMGGQFLLAAIPPFKEILNDFTNHLIREIEKLPIEIHLRKSFDEKSIVKEKPDVMIIATGSKPNFPPIEGLENVRLSAPQDALSQPDQLGKNLLIVGGGGIGAEVADFLSEKGKRVTLVEMRDGIALDLVIHSQYFLNKRLKEKDVRILTSTKVLRFIPSGVLVEDFTGTRKLDGFDSIVMAIGATPNNLLSRSLQGKVDKIHVIGDASKPREVLEALLEAEEVAHQI
jgi:NADPH-dependent 2,4-dienoyl-CoA reductase/sulfur reductase-like enzyme